MSRTSKSYGTTRTGTSRLACWTLPLWQLMRLLSALAVLCGSVVLAWLLLAALGKSGMLLGWMPQGPTWMPEPTSWRVLLALAWVLCWGLVRDVLPQRPQRSRMCPKYRRLLSGCQK